MRQLKKQENAKDVLRELNKRNMGNIKIVRGVFDTKLELEHAGVAAGFPSPADEQIISGIQRQCMSHSFFPMSAPNILH
jgi:hypothetical protein